MNIPALLGTEKQISWALSIRQEAIADAERNLEMLRKHEAEREYHG